MTNSTSPSAATVYLSEEQQAKYLKQQYKKKIIVLTAIKFSALNLVYLFYGNWQSTGRIEDLGIVQIVLKIRFNWKLVRLRASIDSQLEVLSNVKMALKIARCMSNSDALWKPLQNVVMVTENLKSPNAEPRFCFASYRHRKQIL